MVLNNILSSLYFIGRVRRGARRRIEIDQATGEGSICPGVHARLFRGLITVPQGLQNSSEILDFHIICANNDF